MGYKILSNEYSCQKSKRAKKYVIQSCAIYESYYK